MQANETLERCGCTWCMAETRDPSDDGWELDEGRWYCPDCVDYSTDEDGEVLCGHHDVPGIEWGPIETPGGGAPNLWHGRSADGREWVREDRGGWTVPRPVR